MISFKFLTFAVMVKLTIAGPAPKLTELQVYSVESTKCGFENTVGLQTTKCNHGGSVKLRVAVLEIGYGSNRFAWMNGKQVKSINDIPICSFYNNYARTCRPGQTVIGFLVNYNIDGSQSGMFKCQSTSIINASPNLNTLYTEIYIH